MPAENELTRDDDIDIGGILGAIWRRKFMLLGLALVATGLAFAALQFVDAHYRAQADVLIRQSDPVFDSGRNVEGARVAASLDDQGIASQVAILKSRRLARQVIETLDLTSRPEFSAADGSSPLGGLKALLGMERPRSSGSASERALESYFDNLKVYQADRARVVTVEFASTDPELAAAVPNAVMAGYLTAQKDLKRGADPEQLTSLGRELETIKTNLAKAELAVADLRQSSDLLDGRNNESLATQELSEVSTELSRIRSQRARDEARAAAIRRALNGGSLDTAPGISQSPLIQRLRERSATLRSDLAELSTTLLPGHPRVQALRSQLENLEQQIAAEARTILRALQQDAAVAREREQALSRSRDDAKDEASRVVNEQVKLAELERDAAAQREIYNAYLLRYNEATSRANREFLPADAYVISEAKTPAAPYFPKPVPILAGTFAGALLLGMMGVLVAHLNSGTTTARVSSPTGAEARREVENPKTLSAVDSAAAAPNDPLAVPVRPEIVAAPPIAPGMGDVADETEPADAAALNENSADLTARSLALFGRARVVALSPEGNDASAGSLALGRQIARSGSAVVLIDLSGSGTATASVRSLRNALGLRDVVSGVATFDEALHADPATALHILPAGRADVTDPSTFRAVLEQVLAALDGTYDFVVVECGAAGVDALRAVTNRNSVVVVNAPDGETRLVRDAIALMRRNGLDDPLVLTPNPDEMNEREYA